VREALWPWGLLAAVIHWALAGPVLCALSALTPQIPDPVPAPGPYFRDEGRLAALLFFGDHLLYGAVTGALYAALHGGG
jgi:hypothetical protein